MRGLEGSPGGERFTVDQIFSALVDAQMSGADPGLFEARQKVYAIKPEAQSPYAAMGVASDRMRFDLEFWWPEVERLREQGFLLPIEETRRRAEELVGMDHVEILGACSRLSAEAAARAAQVQ